MIELVPANGGRTLERFHRIEKEIWLPFPCYRSTEDDVSRMLVDRKTVFCRHAEVRPFLLCEGGRDVGHVVLIHDRKLPDYVQAAYFGAHPGLVGVSSALQACARSQFPGVPRLVVGLNGHLNYGAGILANRHDEPPLFGYTWTPPYFLDYFADLVARPMLSFRFPSQAFYDFADAFEDKFDPGPIRVRFMNRRRLADEVALYTRLNNECFGAHPYWSDRTAEEDYELFSPFRFLIKEENLIFAERDSEPVGFLLWYPDFQQLVRRSDETLGLRHVLRYHLANPIRTVRLTEIAVKREHRRTMAVPAMILEMIRRVRRGPYLECEGGFIFEDNRPSLAMTLRFITRALGKKPEPYRRFFVYETEL